MKRSSLKFGLIVSLAVHAAVFGVVALNRNVFHPPALPKKDSALILTLVAAPVENVARQIMQTVEVVAPAPVIPAMPIVEEIKKNEPIVPAEKSQPAQTFEPSAPAPLSNPAAIAHGDGSSIMPGLDSTTQTPEAGVKAQPNYLKNPEPFYPALARRRHQEGVVLLSVKVTAQGRAAEVTLKQSSGFPLLDEAALKAVRDWEFVSARVGPVAVESQIEVPLRFRLTK